MDRDGPTKLLSLADVGQDLTDNEGTLAETLPDIVPMFSFKLRCNFIAQFINHFTLINERWKPFRMETLVDQPFTAYPAPCRAC